MMGKKTRILSFLLCLAMLCGLTAPAAEAASFQNIRQDGNKIYLDVQELGRKHSVDCVAGIRHSYCQYGRLYRPYADQTL